MPTYRSIKSSLILSCPKDSNAAEEYNSQDCMHEADAFVEGSKQARDILGSRMVDKKSIDTEKNPVCLGSRSRLVYHQRSKSMRSCVQSRCGKRKSRSRAVCSSQVKQEMERGMFGWCDEM